MELYHSRARIHEANHSIALNTAVVELWRAGEELRAGFQLRLGGGITLLGAPLERDAQRSVFVRRTP